MIVGSYLSRYLEKYSAITFSYSVNKNKSKYYKALEEIASPLNKGDMTLYLISAKSIAFVAKNNKMTLYILKTLTSD